MVAVGEGGTQEEEAGCRRSSLVGQALVPCPTDTASELCKERSFCNPEDTEEAAAIGRQVSCVPCQNLSCNTQVACVLTCNFTDNLQVSRHDGNVF